MNTLKKIQTSKGIVKYVPFEYPIIHPANFRKFEFLKRYGILPRKGVIKLWKKAKKKGGRAGSYKEEGLFARIARVHREFGYFKPVGHDPRQTRRRHRRNIIAKASRRRNR